MTAPGPGRPSRVAVVLAGAGARGAYEAGVMSVVLPRLAREGLRPELYVGTSAGALNATLLAATAHLDVEDQAEGVLDVWRGLTMGSVIRPVLATAPVAALRGLAQLLHVPRVRLTSLLDTAPLRETAARLGRWQELRANIDSGRTGLAVVTTAGDGGRTLVFVDRGPEAAVPGRDDVRGVEYCPVEIDASHILASAAIPVLFPPVRITTPAAQRGWYVDGGMRLNAPLKPALALGADALVVVATHPVASPPEPPGDTPPPDVDDALVAFVDVALVDRMVEDVRTLAKVNGAAAAAGEARGRRTVPYLFCGPERRGTLAEVAARSFDAHPRGPSAVWRDLRRPDLRLLGWLAAGDGLRRGDLLSYLSFDRSFVEAAIDLGRHDAAALLGEAPGVPWVTDGKPKRS